MKRVPLRNPIHYYDKYRQKQNHLKQTSSKNVLSCDISCDVMFSGDRKDLEYRCKGVEDPTGENVVTIETGKNF